MLPIDNRKVKYWTQRVSGKVRKFYTDGFRTLYVVDDKAPDLPDPRVRSIIIWAYNADGTLTFQAYHFYGLLGLNPGEILRGLQILEEEGKLTHSVEADGCGCIYSITPSWKRMLDSTR